jgi:predicted transcriptional regulator
VNDSKPGGQALTAWVPRDLVREIERLAEAGDRSVSREVTRAIREHVASAASAASDDDGRLGGVR